MTMLQMGRPGSPPPGLGGILASMVGPRAPMLPAPSMRPSGPGAAALFNALHDAQAEPVAQQQPVAPALGGVPAAPVGAQSPRGSDIQAALSQNPAAVPPAPQKIGKSRLLAGIVADALAGAMGRPGVFAPMWQRQREVADQRATEEARWHRDRDAKRQDAMRPRVEEVGGSLGWLDPEAQQFRPFYTRPQPFEAYAQAQGLQPGTDEYAQAVEDYRLGGWSDPAMENRTELEGVRHGHRDDLQDQRLRSQRDIAVLRDLTARRSQDVRKSEGAASRSLRAQEGQLNRGATNARAAASRDARAAESYPEGTIIELQGGVTKVRRNGKWVTE